ncbi:MAG: hypothetical protein A2X13_14825 [Bacteroidetes bacterium GWC2_33_15]|nr:MAG: hypothetical protein A2X10_06890 [Bacteroidetes bacterium GWA2_33_15]OFX50224.1 MAG: hypothetical protein A2X13_14825 [Bacteroidetes bacterium GWC2_33_15]OFX65377.1 MAG: hypothetical protein A2X15_04400 [Bacteroidetes bacterium GWB2_32_14]OFX70603.1 MAG: hypothetical protein A2X14_04455 [Bacteroidetes bacterium GWD2_33_33]
MKIRELISDLVEEIDELADIDEKIDVLNYVRKMLHDVSPLKHHPVDYVMWEKSDNVECNDYNPNAVAPPEFKLLTTSIIEDGFTMPIYTNPENSHKTIIDGFHRRKAEKSNKNISDSTFNRIPITLSREDKRDVSNRMASTIRHNRARGSHDIDLMVNIISELTKSGMSDAWIIRHIGMDADELLRLKQISGLAELFKDKEFSNSKEI